MRGVDIETMMSVYSNVNTDKSQSSRYARELSLNRAL